MLVAAIFCLMIATRSSFLYPLNNWDDANSYFSMGKSIFNGQMPYRDVFDQKGMYLYFLYGIAYLISHTTFIGVFALEIVLGFLDVIGFYRIIMLFIGNENDAGADGDYKTSIAAAGFSCLTFAVIVCSRSFWWGGSAEEICLPLYIWGLYISVRYFKNIYPQKAMSFKDVFIGGLLAGFIANIKFTGLGFFFAWMMMVFFSFLSCKEFVNGIKACFVFLFGMFVTFIPWIIYFGIKGALFEWYWGYVYVNVFVYTDVESANPGTMGRINQMVKILYWLIRDNPQYFVFVIIGIIYAFFGKKQKFMTRLNVPVLFAFMFLGFFGGGRELPYYSLPLSVFAIFGFAFIGHLLTEYVLKDSNENKSKLLSFAALTIAVLLVYFNSMNVPFMKVSRDDYFMYRFRDRVLETENPTLLNVGCLDAGLYTLCDIVPSCRWFQTQTLNIKEPENNPYLEQERYVKEGLIDYVLVRDYIPESINDHYELCDKETYGWDGAEFNYYLYKKVR
ncbi:hypothetical protein [Butyrivibrio sp. AE3004]|uniref:hypothetical protein n=1 Tax=Butyrivibrio sp. AE3004 TaxID=1506994 RepID=UPI0018CC102F|nr:hypothetical protein [Butyrivibrio sp. AE3004]